MKPKMTKEEYVASRRTLFDKILFYSWVPFVINFVLMAIAVMNGQEEGARILSFVAVLCLVLVIVCRGVILADREWKYLEDYYEKYLKD